jgi:fatty acid desaturase
MAMSSADSPHIDHARLRELMQPSLFEWSIRVFGDWMVIVIPMMIAGLTHHWAAYVFAVIMTGVGQHRLALMAHEGSHRQASRNKRLNDVLVGFFTLWPFANPVGGYRRFHFNHHRYLNTDGDPELTHKRKSAPAWDLPADWRRAAKYFLLDVCLFNVKELVHLGQNARPGTSRIDRLLPTFWYAGALGAIWYTGAWWILAVWFLGTAIVFWPIFRLRIWTEHVGTHDVHRIHAPWWLRFVLLPHNTWYHYEHHHFPQVPCWNLPKVRALVGDSPEIFPLGYVLGYYRRAPQIPSGAPTRRLKEQLPKFDPRRVAEIPTEWEDGRLSGIGAGTGGDAVYHTEDEIREHAPHLRSVQDRPLEESVAS